MEAVSLGAMDVVFWALVTVSVAILVRKLGQKLSRRAMPRGVAKVVSGSSTTASPGGSAMVPYSAGQGRMHETIDGHCYYVHERLPEDVICDRARTFYKFMNTRRCVRFFSPDPVPDSVIEDCILAAGTSPSGAHHQPWHFVVVKNPDVRRKVREKVEEEERINYERRMKKSWVADVHGLVSHLHEDGVVKKPYLTEAPAFIVVMRELYRVLDDGTRADNYYVQESCGLAVGLLLAAIHNANLSTVVTTPMNATGEIARLLGRPSNEKVFLLLPIGFPAKEATVPFRDEKAYRKPKDRLMTVV